MSTFLFLLASLTAVGQMAQTLFVPGQGAIAQEFAIAPGQTQLLMALYLFCYGLSQFCYGPWSDAVGRRPVILFGLAVFCLGSLLATFAASFELLLLGSAVQGLGSGVGGVMARTVPRDRFEGPQLTRVNGLLGMALIFSPILAPVIGGGLVSWFDWRACYGFLAGFSVLVWVLLWLAFDETHAEAGAEQGSLLRRYQSVWREPVFQGHLWTLVAVFAGVVVFEAVAGILLGERLGYPAWAVSLMFVLPLPPYVAGSFAAAFFSTRWSHNRLMKVGLRLLLASALLLLLLAWALPLSAWSLLLPVSCYFFAAGLLGPVATSGALSPFRKGAGAAGALLGGLQNLGCGLAAALSAQIPQHDALPLGALLSGFAVLAIWQGRKVGETHQQVVEHASLKTEVVQ
ncbi:MFS transporter [Gallaecimonas sp. GXIMD4217]|uniref:MFS transporter n=1 Tax=Gallaecimonas sp. GXIMD4217 TaxID=3131927 RepID=UPI00311AF160